MITAGLVIPGYRISEAGIRVPFPLPQPERNVSYVSLIVGTLPKSVHRLLSVSIASPRFGSTIRWPIDLCKDGVILVTDTPETNCIRRSWCFFWKVYWHRRLQTNEKSLRKARQPIRRLPGKPVKGLNLSLVRLVSYLIVSWHDMEINEIDRLPNRTTWDVTKWGKLD